MTETRPELRDILVIFDGAEDLVARLAERHPGLRFSLARNAEAVSAKLQEFAPDAMFSINAPGFPVSAHQEAARAPSLRFIQVGGSGYEHIGPWDPAQTALCNCAGVLAPALSETVLAGILALNGNFTRYLAQQKNAEWRQHAFRPLKGQRLTIAGLGAIGREVGKRARALGMHVTGLRREARQDESCDRCLSLAELPEILPETDILSIHLRQSPETTRLIDRKALMALPPGALVINTARGPILDSGALLDLLHSGHIGGAYLDVFDEEPLAATHPLWQAPNLIITPHAADNIRGWPLLFADRFAENLSRWHSGEALLGAVMPAR